MGDIAKCSVCSKDEYYNEDLLYDIHAWGYEPCTMKHIKAYKPESSSLGSGQVLNRPYTFNEGRIILKEMIDSLCLDLVAKNLVTDQITWTKDSKTCSWNCQYRQICIISKADHTKSFKLV
ncbi:hypothetical protein [Thomasclavelia ramosa]|uniref:hypothetical protein n=1 Tax=Thomasclavelia ramosa TaxID=1547 RepID=UPI0022E2BAEF|nr:hypothetical protein [Thomasclavelia ramosa]